MNEQCMMGGPKGGALADTVPAVEPPKEEETPEAIPQGEADISHDDTTPSIIDQARGNGWDADYYHFGKLEGQGTDFFNPGIIERNDGIWMLTRASGLHPQGFMYGQNTIVAFKLDDAGKQPHHGKILKWPVENPQQHFEDPRGFYHPDLKQTMVGCCTFMWNGPGDWTGPHQAFGAFDEDWMCKKMNYPMIGGNPGNMDKITEHSKYEKNWLWWLHDDKLHLLYKANPWMVYRFGDRWNDYEEIKYEGIHWPYGEIRGGTTPVRIGDLYFTFHHSSLAWRGRYRRYYAGALAFEAKPPFYPKLITDQFLLQGSQNDPWAQRKPLVVFPCGAIFRNNHWLVSCGVNDMKSAWFELSHEALLSRMKPINEVGETIFTAIGLSPAELVAERNLSGGGNVQEAVIEPCLEATKAAAQTTLEKRRANAAKARAAKAAKRLLSGNVGVASCADHRESTESVSDEAGTTGIPSAQTNLGGSKEIRQSRDTSEGGESPTCCGIENRHEESSPAQTTLEKRRANAAKARVAKAAKRKDGHGHPESIRKQLNDLSGGLSGGNGVADDLQSPPLAQIPRKRRKRRRRTATPEARLAAAEEFAESRIVT